MIIKAEIPFIRLLIPFLIGLILAYFYPSNWLITPLFITLICCFSVLACINIYYAGLKAYYHKGTIGIGLFFMYFLFGILNCLLHNQSLKNNFYANKNYTYLKVWVANEPEEKNNILRFETTVTQTINHQVFTPATGNLLIALKIDKVNKLHLNYGDELIIATNAKPIEAAYNPAEFDFKQWLSTKNIYHQSFINENQLVKLNINCGNPLKKFAIEVRKSQVNKYRKLIKDDEAFAVASTLVLGDRANLDQETLNAYSKTGTIHALSVSGMHVGLIYLLLNWLLFFLNGNRILKILKLSTIIVVIWYYSLLTGLAPSIFRAAVMLTVFIIAKAFNKSSNSYNIIAFTAFCLLFYDPYLIWNVGFQLSFLAVFGLIYLQPKIYKWFYFKNKWLNKLWNLTAISLAAQLATFPLSIYYFHQFPIYFIVSNLFIVLPITAIMYIGIAILLVRVYFLAPIFEWLILFTNNTLKLIASLPYAGINGIWINQWQLLLLSIALILLILAFTNYSKKLLFVSIILFIALQSIHFKKSIIFSQQRKIIFYSLRKNYAAAFIDGNKAILVTDLTAADQNFRFFVQPCLSQLQVTQLKFINWDQDADLNAFLKKNHQLRFYNYNILLVDESFNNRSIGKTPAFNTIWLHDNAKIGIKKLTTEIKFKTLVIDASNKDYQIEKQQKEAKKNYLNYYILKKNKAYLVDLN